MTTSKRTVLCAWRYIWLPPLLLCLSGTAHAQVNRHVVIVGVNTSVDVGVVPLSFADDDAARYAELLGPDAASMSVLTILDAEAQVEFEKVAAVAVLPTKDAFYSAIDDAFSGIKKDIDAGKDADLVLILVGHGGVLPHGEGYLSLSDERLTRSQLFSEVIAKSPARFNHVIVDACSAYLLVNRGLASDAVRGFLQKDTLAHFPNTGALLATSRDQATHEWTRIRGGVFSHQVLSALAGAADVNNDQVLSYPEVGAFVEAANAGVSDRRARVDMSLTPPRSLLSRPLWQQQGGDRLLLPQPLVGRVSLLDARGMIVLDVNKNAEQPLPVLLRGRAPYVVVVDGVEHDVTQENPLLYAIGPPHPTMLHARASLDDALKAGLFQVPFGLSYVRGYEAHLQRAVVAEVPVSSAVRSLDSGNSLAHGAPSGDWPIGPLALVGVAASTALVGGGAWAWMLVRVNEVTSPNSFTRSEAERLVLEANIALWTGVVASTVSVSALAMAAWWGLNVEHEVTD